MFTRLKRVVAGALGAALLIGGGAGAAVAAPASVIDTDLKGNIHLTKYDDAAGRKDPDGTKDQGQINAQKIAGIEFTLTQITQVGGKDVDLTTNEGRAAVANLTGSEVKANTENYTFGAADKKTTNTDGQIDWTGKDLGVYLLEETNSTTEDGTTYRAAAPSIVFLPTTDPGDQSSWIKEEDGKAYAVWVYPKNSLEETEKKVKDADTHVGDKITYEISSTIPAGKLKDYNFYDTLDEKLSLKADDISVKAGDNALTKGTHYEVGLWPAEGTGQKLYVHLTDAGLRALEAAKEKNSSARAVLTIQPTVTASGVIPNEAYVFKNEGEGEGSTQPPGETPPEVPEGSEESNIVATAYGKVNIKKRAENENGTPLKGAEFQVYDAADTEFANPIEVNGKTTFVTDEKGNVTIDGLHAGDFADDGTLAQPKKYVLVETKAPEGYELIQNPIEFEVNVTNITKIVTKKDADGNPVSVEEISLTPDNADADLSTKLVADATVVNIKAKPKLPFTGGAGIWLFGLIGLLVVAGGIYYTRKSAQA